MAENDKAEETKKGGGGNKLLLIVLPVVVIAAAGGIYVAMGSKTAEVPTGPQMGPVEKLETFIVNLDEPGGNRYLKIGINVETKQALTESQKKLTLKVRDAIIVYLSGLRIADVQQTDAKKQMKAELLKIANEVYGTGTIVGVYFVEFVIQ